MCAELVSAVASAAGMGIPSRLGLNLVVVDPIDRSSTVREMI